MIQERKIVTKIPVLWDHTMNEYIKGPKVLSILNVHIWQKTAISCTPQLTIQKKALGTNWMHSTFMPYFQLKQFMSYKMAIAVCPFMPYYHQA